MTVRRRYPPLLLLSLLGTVVFLTGCGTRGILCPEGPEMACVKNYCLQGNATLGGGAPVASGDLMGQIWSHGLVLYRPQAIPEAVMLEALNKGCTGDPPQLPAP